MNSFHGQTFPCPARPTEHICGRKPRAKFSVSASRCSACGGSFGRARWAFGQCATGAKQLSSVCQMEYFEPLRTRIQGRSDKRSSASTILEGSLRRNTSYFGIPACLKSRDLARPEEHALCAILPNAAPHCKVANLSKPAIRRQPLAARFGTHSNFFRFTTGLLMISPAFTRTHGADDDDVFELVPLILVFDIFYLLVSAQQSG